MCCEAEKEAAFVGSMKRVSALVVRYLYLMQSSWPRILELAYWPTVQMILWGLINRFLAGHSDWVAQTGGLLIGAVLLWDVLFRAQLGVSLPFFEELYSRNLGNLFVTPLRPSELVAGLLVISLMRTLIGVGAAAGLAVLLYRYSVFDMGLPLLAFFTHLIVMGWSIGLMVVALVMRWGLGAEGLAWAIIFAFAPLSGIYYPISVLPGWLQNVALCMPSAHVFEGMRALVRDHYFPMDHFWSAAALNVVYMLIGLALFLLSFRVARKKGLLLQMGE